MAAFVEFIEPILTEGTVLLRRRPAAPADERDAAGRLLEKAFTEYRLRLAGPLISFDRAAAVAGAEWLWWGCWYLVDRSETPDDVRRALPRPLAPVTAAQHLSADLLLRHLAQVQRRARAIASVDVLHEWLSAILRLWPLAGVLADLPEGPAIEPELGGHPGLRLLYAERLALRPQRAWMPAGPTRDYVDLVFFERGLALPDAAAARSTT
jgi:hypothetical protein